MADYICLVDEDGISKLKEITIFDPLEPWKKQTLTNVTLKPMLVKIFDRGKCVYESPSIHEIKAFATEQIDTLWDEVKRFEYPHQILCGLLSKLWEEQRALLEKGRKIKFKIP